MSTEPKNEWWEDDVNYPFDPGFRDHFIGGAVREQQRRDWEEFREMITRIKEKEDVKGCCYEATHHCEATDDMGALDFTWLFKMIDSKLSSLKSDKK